jgi:multiple sugar transport system substrate-binding protein
MAAHRILILSVAAASVLALAGCATSLSADADDLDYSADATDGSTLSVMGFSASDDVAETRYDRAVAALDGVDVKLTEGELDLQQFLAAVSAGSPPDLVYIDRDQIGSLAARGALAAVDGCIEEQDIDAGQFREAAIDQITLSDAVYGVPEFNQVEITMANSQLLEAAGLTLADVNGSDWSAVTAANEKLSVSNGGTLSVIGYDSKLHEFFPLWAMANGTELLSADGKTANLDDPKAVEALEFAAEIYASQGGFGTVKAFRDSADFFGAGNQFASNTLGAMPMEQWYVNVLNDVSPDAPLAFDTFRDRDGEPLAFSSGSAWAVPAGSEHAATACAFVKSMTETEAWIAAAEARQAARTAEGKPFTGILTGNEQADEQIREMVGDSAPAPWQDAIDAIYEANEHSFSFAASPADAEFTSIWQDAVNAVLTDGEDPQAALSAAQEKAQSALDDAWSSFGK